MSRPPSMTEAHERRLVAEEKQGIHTFSNGTEWECWASGNCLSCRWYELDGQAGEFCAFECASMLDLVSPEMAQLFGWTQNPEYATYQGAHDPIPGRHGWESPDSCRFFKDRTDDEDGGRSRSPDPDPLQLVLIADPTEAIAGIAPTPVEPLTPVLA